MTNAHTAFFDGDRNLAPILMLHGTGGDESDLLPIATFLFPQHPKLGIRGRITQNQQNRYFIRHEDGTFDLNNVAEETSWLMNTIQSETQKYDLDARQLIVLGYSNGANIAAYAWRYQQPPFKTAVLLHPMQITDAVSSHDLSGIRAFASFGDLDPIVTESNFDHLTSELTNAGAEVKVFKNHQSHHLTQEELQAAKDWIATVL